MDFKEIFSLKLSPKKLAAPKKPSYLDELFTTPKWFSGESKYSKKPTRTKLTSALETPLKEKNIEEDIPKKAGIYFSKLLDDSGEDQFTLGNISIEKKAETDLKTEIISIGTTEKTFPDKKIKILFMTSKDSSLEEKRLQDAPHELFEKMVAAMKIDLSEIDFWFSLTEDQEDIQKAIEKIAETNPQFIITLGGMASNNLLSLNEKLHTTHGRFFERKIENKKEDLVFKVVPLFHPEYLLVNPKMKKAAWEDLQKILQSLNE